MEEGARLADQIQIELQGGVRTVPLEPLQQIYPVHVCYLERGVTTLQEIQHPGQLVE
jgi:hypothetical protein